jgi:hypothetical protein
VKNNIAIRVGFEAGLIFFVKNYASHDKRFRAVLRKKAMAVLADSCTGTTGFGHNGISTPVV